MTQLTVRTMSKLSGVTAHTLRAWEKRYGAIKPSRTTGGQRSYSMEDLERLRKLKKLTESGHSIGQIARLTDEEINQLILSFKKIVVKNEISESGALVAGRQIVSSELRQIPVSASNYAVDRQPIAGLINQLAEFKLDEVYRSLTASRMRYGARDFVLKVVQPLLFEIGILVANGTMSISQEHAFSAILRDQLGHMIQTSKTNLGHDTVVFCSPEGDWHEFGILMGKILSLSHGLKTHNLGPNLPVDSLIFAINALAADHVVISFAPLPNGSLALPIEEYVLRLKKSVSKNTNIIVGGQGVTSDVREKIKGVAVYVESLDELDCLFERISSHE